jgi:hypothetical protein
VFKFFAIFFKFWKILLPILLFISVALYLRFGFGGAPAEAPPVEEAPPVSTEETERHVLACTPDCMAWGQCGRFVNRGDALAILAHTVGPALAEHDAFFANGAPVRFVGSQTRWVTETIIDPGDFSTTDESRRVLFHRVVELNEADQDVGTAAWLPEWCVR